MSHMQAQAYLYDWYEYEYEGETFVTDDDTSIPEDAKILNTYHDKWFSRLSAPGFTDCTDWIGPCKTEDGALWELYQQHGNDSETFYSFIGDGKKIVWGTLRLTGMRNELYGQVVGETWYNKPEELHLATMGDFALDEETGEIFEGYDPNDDPDLSDAYKFEEIQGDELLGLAQRVKNAERDSENYRTVTISVGWSDHTWGIVQVDIPAEYDDFQKRAKDHFIRMGDNILSEDSRLELNLGLDLPNPLFYTVLEWTEPTPYSDAYPKYDLMGPIGDTGTIGPKIISWRDEYTVD